MTLVLAGMLISAGVSGCASEHSNPASDRRAEQAKVITVHDAWVKATPSGMTAAYGEISNRSNSKVTIVSASTDVASRVELHEMKTEEDGSRTMKQHDGGFALAPGETMKLEPGANHLMLMGLNKPLDPGAKVSIEMKFEDGSTRTFPAVTKEFAGGGETYKH